MNRNIRNKRIMKPIRFWIDGTIYDIGRNEGNAAKYIKPDEEGKYSTSFRLPKLYYDKLHNDPKYHLSKIKRSPNTEILVPTQEGNVKISASTLEEISDTHDDFHWMLHNIRQNIKPRQFIAIPTLSNEIKDNFTRFKEQLMARKETIANLDESVFQKAEKLHITVCVMALLDHVEIAEGKRLLTELQQEVIKSYFAKKQAIRIRLKGLSCMDTNRKKVNVLYANAKFVDEDDECNLQAVSNRIADFFYEKGLMKDMRDADVKIHVTLINTKYRKANKKQRWAKRIPIDGTAILDEFADHDFGTCAFDTVHLSLMSRNDGGGDCVLETDDFDGFYKPLAIAQLHN